MKKKSKSKSTTKSIANREIPDTGSVSGSMIAGEYGGDKPYKLSNYYGMGNAPQSGTVAYSMYRGTSSRGEALKFTIKTPEDNKEFFIPCVNVGLYDAIVDWGDGTDPVQVDTWDSVNLRHVYATRGKYQVKVVGNLPHLSFQAGASMSGADPSSVVADLASIGSSVNFNVETKSEIDEDGEDINRHGTYGTTNSRMIWSVEDLGEVGATTYAGMWYGCENIRSFNVGSGNSSDMTNLSYMMFACAMLKSVDLSALQVGKVETLDGLFGWCSSLEYLNCSGWDTSSTTSMFSLFLGLTKLQSLDVSHFNTSLVTNMGYTFGGMYSLTSLPISGWDVSAVSSFWATFANSPNLSVDLSSWNTSSVTSLRSMFQGCESMDLTPVMSWDTSKVASMASMFQDCQWNGDLNLSTWNTGACKEFNSMFASAQFQSLDGLRFWDFRGANSWESGSPVPGPLYGFMNNFALGQWVAGDYDGLLTRLYDQHIAGELQSKMGTLADFGWETYDPTSEAMRAELRVGADWGNIYDGGAATGRRGDFTMHVKTINDSGNWENFIIPLVDNGEKVDVTVDWGDGSDTLKVTTANDMRLRHSYAARAAEYVVKIWMLKPFNSGDGGIGHISYRTDLPIQTTVPTNFDTQRDASPMSIDQEVTTDDRIEAGVMDTKNTHEVWWDAELDRAAAMVAKVTNMGSYKWTTLDSMFYNCVNMRSFACGDVSANSGIDSNSRITSTANMFAGCTSLKLCYLQGLSMRYVTKTNSMFSGCASLENLDMYKQTDTRVNTTTQGMFMNCTSLQGTMFLGNLMMQSCEDTSKMFYNCTSVSEVDCIDWDTSSVKDMSSMFYGIAETLPTLEVARWDTSQCTKMSSMFAGVKTKVIDCRNWDTSKVTTMAGMFWLSSQTDAKQSGIFSNWDTSNVNNMSSMFLDTEILGVAGTVTYGIEGWDFTQAVQQTDGLASFMGEFFSSGKVQNILSTDQYDKLLNNWAVANGPYTYTQKPICLFNYSDVGATGRAALTGQGWEITDLGQA